MEKMFEKFLYFQRKHFEPLSNAHNANELEWQRCYGALWNWMWSSVCVWLRQWADCSQNSHAFSFSRSPRDSHDRLSSPLISLWSFPHCLNSHIGQMTSDLIRLRIVENTTDDTRQRHRHGSTEVPSPNLTLTAEFLFLYNFWSRY